MNIGYTLHMPFWSRVKLLFGFGLRVEVEGERITNISTYVVGEENTLTKLVKIRGAE